MDQFAQLGSPEHNSRLVSALDNREVPEYWPWKLCHPCQVSSSLAGRDRNFFIVRLFIAGLQNFRVS